MLHGLLSLTRTNLYTCHVILILFFSSPPFNHPKYLYSNRFITFVIPVNTSSSVQGLMFPPPPYHHQHLLRAAHLCHVSQSESEARSQNPFVVRPSVDGGNTFSPTNNPQQCCDKTT